MIQKNQKQVSKDNATPCSLIVIITGLSSGGTERHLLQILPQLPSLGYNIKIINLSKKHNELEDLFKQSNIEVLTPPYPNNASRLQYLFTALRFIKQHIKNSDKNSTIIHTFLPAAYAIGMVSKIVALSSIPLIMSRRSLNYYQEKYFCFKILERTFHKIAHYLIANSQAVLKQLIVDEKANPHKVHLIYNGIDLSRFENTADPKKTRKDLKISNNAVVLSIVANLIPYKGHKDLIQALGSCKDQLPKEWHLLVIGRDDGIQHELEMLSTKLKIDSHIHFLGSRNDIPDLLHASNIGLLVSHEEGFSNAVIEGMAAGLPMIVTNVGGNAEAIVHKQFGLVVDPKSPDQLAKAITKLANDKERQHSYGKAAQNHARENYSLERCVSEYVQLYKSIVKN